MSEFVYRVPWRAASVYPGAHPGKQAGTGMLFRWHVPLIQYPDPRRIDLRASLLDPFQTCQVRVQEQRASIPVFVIVDLSASMAYQGQQHKLKTVADFLSSLADSAHRLGDAVGLAAFAEGSRPVLYQPLSRQTPALRNLAVQISQLKPKGSNARGLAKASQFLPAQRSLVFFLSDYHLPIAFLIQVLTSLSRHDVVPVVLWDKEEALPQPSGLASLQDLETGQERLLWLRPQLRQRMQSAYAERRQRLAELFRQLGREPLFLKEGFKAEAVSRYFLEGV